MLENYHQDEFGVIHQTNWTPKIYDKQYLTYYEGLRDRTIKLGYQRIGWVLGLLHRIPENVFEIGYGTGTFLEAASLAGVAETYGYDVARYPLPEGSEFIEWEQALGRSWDLTVLFDVLEHIPDLSFLSRLQTKSLAVAVPYCRWQEFGDEWFDGWRMRLRDEHVHHFDRDSLCKLLQHYGYRPLDLNFFEDGLRLRDGETGPNVLSGFFLREEAE